jgi:4,5-DOPA dioxygenase extradiol
VSHGGQERRLDQKRAPALFVSHGSPLASMNEDFANALRRFGAKLRPPRSIVIVSAHWEAMRPIRVTGSRTPTIERDFDGFPSWLESRTYRCPGSPPLAAEIVKRLSSAGLAAMLDMTRGLDDAAWLPLSLVFPNGKVPVVEISIPKPSTPQEMRNIGRALGPLRYEGVLLVGSGGVVYNESQARFDRHEPPTEPWAIAFDSWVRDRLDALDEEALHAYRTQGPHAHLASSTSEHLDPLFFVLGTYQKGDCVHHVFEGFHAGVLSLRSFALAGRRTEDLHLPDALTLGA